MVDNPVIQTVQSAAHATQTLRSAAHTLRGVAEHVGSAVVDVVQHPMVQTTAVYAGTLLTGLTAIRASYVVEETQSEVLDIKKDVRQIKKDMRRMNRKIDDLPSMLVLERMFERMLDERGFQAPSTEPTEHAPTRGGAAQSCAEGAVPSALHVVGDSEDGE